MTIVDFVYNFYLHLMQLATLLRLGFLSLLCLIISWNITIRSISIYPNDFKQSQCCSDRACLKHNIKSQPRRLYTSKTLYIAIRSMYCYSNKYNNNQICFNKAYSEHDTKYQYTCLNISNEPFQNYKNMFTYKNKYELSYYIWLFLQRNNTTIHKTIKKVQLSCIRNCIRRNQYIIHLYKFYSYESEEYSYLLTILLQSMLKIQTQLLSITSRYYSLP